MINVFLKGEAINVPDDEFRSGFKELISVTSQDMNYENFFRHDSIYSQESLMTLYRDMSQQNQAILQYIEQHSPIDENFDDHIRFDKAYPQNLNGFTGIDFTKTTIEKSRQIKSEIDYEEFKSQIFKHLKSRNFWELKDKLFARLCFCPSVKNQIINLGDSKPFDQVINQLIELDKYLKGWKEKNFSYKDLKLNSSITLSLESSTTMNKYSEERRFKLPDGTSEIFELHVKFGDFRMHVLPKNDEKKLYIGYIGKHLTISSQ